MNKQYQPLAVAAGHVGTNEQTLIEFHGAGWINVVSKEGKRFVSNQDEYRSRFILHLRQQLKLTDEEIGIVLTNEKPPYSLAQVPSILARHASKR
jgi:hypothetical protein